MENLIKDIKESFLNEFPRGYINIRPWNKDISLTIGLIDDLQAVSSQIRENDPMIHKFIIFKESDSWKAHLSHGALSIKSNDPIYAMNHIKTGFRKTTGNSDKILKMYTKFFKKLKVLVHEQKENIYQYEKYQSWID